MAPTISGQCEYTHWTSKIKVEKTRELSMQKLLNPQEMADCLGVEKSTIYQWTHQGFIPHIKLGKFVRFREGDVMQWLDKRTQNGRMTRRVQYDLR